MTPDIPAADGSSPKTQRFDAPPPMVIDPAKRYTAEMATNKGTMTIALDAVAAPKTVNNFVFLARCHYYDGIVFHRIIPGFMCQGGDPEGSGRGGPGYRFEDELPAPGRYEIGSLAMANAGPEHQRQPVLHRERPDGVGLPPSYSLFGKVVKGLDVVSAIEAVGQPVGSTGEHGRHRVGDHHRIGLTGRQRRPRPRADRAPSGRQGVEPGGSRGAVDEDGHLGRRRRRATGRRGSRMRAVRSGIPATGVPAGASRTARCIFSPWTSSATSPKWGTTASPPSSPRPMVNPPPRASTIGSVRAMAAPEEPATTAPSLPGGHQRLPHLECLSTLRRCIGELPAR